jgi:hypothetical protein
LAILTQNADTKIDHKIRFQESHHFEQKMMKIAEDSDHNIGSGLPDFFVSQLTKTTPNHTKWAKCICPNRDILVFKPYLVQL